MRKAACALTAIALLALLQGPAEGAGTASPIIELRAPGPAVILIPGGTFLMGSTEDDLKYAIALCRKEPRGDDLCEKLFVNETEAHEVTLSPYFMDRTEVTVGAYRRCVE